MLLDINESERRLILKALRNEVAINKNHSNQISRLVSKIASSPQRPDITVGVHGGQVQWILGNPFPVRICDYDGEREDLPDVDERGQQCRMWFEPADSVAVQS